VGAGKAVFIDRDGVLNDLVYNAEEGQVSSPLSARQMRVFPFVPESVKALQELGYKVIVVSNQPGVGKRQFTLAEMNRMNAKLRKALSARGIGLDGEYYCLHHPEALVERYRVVCDCRKPKPGLLFRAAEDFNLDFADSFIVGDGFVDVKAGRSAGCRTILVAHMTTLLTKMIEEEDATPDYLVPSLMEVPALLKRISTSRPSGSARRRSSRVAARSSGE
jgi:D-glycero-D-manno-heptose 1,7-bisphosphate phosphatase